MTLKQVGRDLGVRYVLEGSVRKAGNRLRITAQLVDAVTDHHLWAERYDRDMGEIFAVQEEVARHVADALQVALKPDESARLHQIPTENVEAYELYLRTRTTAWPPTRENLLSARSAYQRIIDIDPSFAGGYAGKSITHSLAVIFGQGEGSTEDTEIALTMANQAIVRQNEFCQSYSAIALAHSALGQHDEAVAAARRAFELNPGDADSNNFGAISFMLASRGEEARAASGKAIRVNPQYIANGHFNGLGIGSFLVGKYDEAIDAFDRNVELGGPLGPGALAFRTASCIEAGSYGEKLVTV